MSIRRSLVYGSVLLIAAAIAVLALSLHTLIFRPLADDLTLLEMRQASQQVTADLTLVFARIKALVGREQDWGERGLLDTARLAELNNLLYPLLRSDIGVTSMAIADETGREVLIFQANGDRWTNRLTDPVGRGPRARFLTWSGRGELIDETDAESDYDARDRPWFKGGMLLPADGEIYWTPPYSFVSTKLPGMSAVTSWQAPDGRRYVMTTDITLANLSRFTRQITVGKSGIAALLTDDDRVLGLPRDPRFDIDAAVGTTVLQRVDAVGVRSLAAAVAEWRAAGRPEGNLVGFSLDGEAWLASFSALHLGAEVFWIATLARPDDFGLVGRNTLAKLILVALDVIGLASLCAVLLGQRFAKPIEQLTAESARIGRMDLARPIAVQSGLREIDTLAASLDEMRVALGREIGERERAEAARSRAQEQLLEASKRDALGRLAGGIAHDFNNTLGAMLGFAGFLVEDLAEGSPQRLYAQRIIKAGENAKDLVAQILVFARGSTLERRLCDLALIIEEARDLLRASLPSSTVIDTLVETCPALAEVNPTQINQLLFNLCLNANDALAGRPGRIRIGLDRLGPGQASPPGGEAPEAGAAVGVVGAGDANDGIAESFALGSLDPVLRYAKISVADDGPGIDPGILEHIFDPFFTTKERGRGTGLGLAVVQGIVMSYGGACVVTSLLGAGASFEIYLPLTEGVPADPASDAARELRVLPGEKGRVLVVDDERALVDMLTTGLERLGYAVTGANDPRAALEAFKAAPGAWLAVISDQVMPYLKGVELFEQLRAIRPGLPFVLCTGYDAELEVGSGPTAGMLAVLGKPVAPAQIAALLARLDTKSENAKAADPVQRAVQEG
jgi:signal transduction histidine kinase/CheY-like chemotaxis protein